MCCTWGYQLQIQLKCAWKSFFKISFTESMFLFNNSTLNFPAKFGSLQPVSRERNTYFEIFTAIFYRNSNDSWHFLASATSHQWNSMQKRRVLPKKKSHQSLLLQIVSKESRGQLSFENLGKIYTPHQLIKYLLFFQLQGLCFTQGVSTPQSAASLNSWEVRRKVLIPAISMESNLWVTVGRNVLPSKAKTFFWENCATKIDQDLLFSCLYWLSLKQLATVFIIDMRSEAINKIQFLLPLSNHQRYAFKLIRNIWLITSLSTMNLFPMNLSVLNLHSSNFSIGFQVIDFNLFKSHRQKPSREA